MEGAGAGRHMRGGSMGSVTMPLHDDAFASSAWPHSSPGKHGPMHLSLLSGCDCG